MEKHITALIINITDICNMTCPHCMRGDSRNRKLNMALIPRIFDGISSIDSLTITGGEPSCYCECVTAIVDYLVKHKDTIAVYGFYIITNGKLYCQELIDAVKTMLLLHLSRYYPRSIEYELEDALEDAQECNAFSISVSLDQYHEPIETINYLKYRTCGVYSNIKETDFSEIDPISRGRGKNLETAAERPYQSLFIEQEEDNILADTVYITVNGDVYGDCDMSYEMEDEIDPAGNLNDNTLAEILESNVDNYY